MKLQLSAFLLLFGVLLLLPARPAQAQKGMEKHDFYAYLLRSGQAPPPPYAAKLQGPTDIKINVLDIGNVRARIRNTGTLGYDRDLLCYEFPFNSQITYRWTLGPMFAGKISGQRLVSGAAYGAVRGTTEDEYRPLRGFDAGEFIAEQNIGIAFSDKPASWPASWPTLDQLAQSNGAYVIDPAARDAFLQNPHFDATATGTARVGPSGFPGVADGEIRAPREAYFVITDNDPAEGGKPVPLNIRVDVWALQWDDFVNRNFIIYKLLFTNIGNQTIEDVYVGIHDDPDAPEQGSNEWTDDYAYLIPPGKDSDGDGTPDADADPRADVDNDGLYTRNDSLLWNTLYLWDGDDKSEGFLANGVGWIGLKFLETPSDPATGQPRGVTSLDIFQYTAAPNTDSPGYDQMAGILHVGLPSNDPQQGGGTPIIQPDWPDGAPDDIFKVKNSYGPDVTITAASGPYTLRPGESLPFTFASVHGSSQSDLLNNAQLTQILFNAGYKAASGPPTPRVVAVPADGQVTLYWDDTAERGIYPDGTVGDPLTGNNAFEGYKIYRSDDGGRTFGKAVVDIYGTTQGYLPLAIYDLQNGQKGESSTRRFFNLGDDTGLRHTFVDTDVENGREYLYAVVAYDGQDGPVPPLETPINVANPDAPDDNTVRVRPMSKAAGIVSGEVDPVARKVAGNADLAEQEIEVVDPNALVSGTYRITFAHDEAGALTYTVQRGGQTVQDLAGHPVAGVGLYDAETDYAPIFDGVRAYIENVAYDVKDVQQTAGSGLEVAEVLNLGAAAGWGVPAGLSADYEIRFTDRSWTYADYDNGDAVSAPFEIYNITTGEKVHAEIVEGEDDGVWGTTESIYVVNTPYPADEAEAAQWLGAFPDDYVYRVILDEASTYAAGDVLQVTSNKPLTPDDVFEFNVRQATADKATLEEEIDEITVVPNPFIVSSAFEVGRFGVARELQFHQLPEQCSIRIFTTAGELVQRIQHDGGSIAAWNLQTYNGQEVAYGVYLYVVRTPDGVEQTGKFAVIK